MRAPTVLTSLLVTLGATVVAVVPVGSSSADPAAPELFHDRWCSTGHASPCILSATRNGSTVGPTDATYTVTSTGRIDDPNIEYTDLVMWAVDGPLSTSQTWSVTLDMGAMKPRYTEGYSEDMVVTRTPVSGGTWQVTMTGKPVLMAEGCNDAFPADCPAIADDEAVDVRFDGEVWNLDTDGGDDADRNGVDRSQNADMVNDPSYAPTGDGGYALEVELANAPRYQTSPDDSVGEVFYAHAKFRLPYQHFRMRFGVPNPATLPESSVTGSTAGAGTAGVWTITKKPSEQAFYAEVDGVTFGPTGAAARTMAARVKAATTPRVLRIKRGVITPYAPTNVTATRVTSGRGRVSFSASVARGALPTGYRASCTNLAKTHTRPATATTSPVVVRELRRGVAYDCKVRALSKAGPGAWSPVKRLAARP